MISLLQWCYSVAAELGWCSNQERCRWDWGKTKVSTNSLLLLLFKFAFLSVMAASLSWGQQSHPPFLHCWQVPFRFRADPETRNGTFPWFFNLSSVANRWGRGAASKASISVATRHWKGLTAGLLHRLAETSTWTRWHYGGFRVRFFKPFLAVLVGRFALHISILFLKTRRYVWGNLLISLSVSFTSWECRMDLKQKENLLEKPISPVSFVNVSVTKDLRGTILPAVFCQEGRISIWSILDWMQPESCIVEFSMI